MITQTAEYALRAVAYLATRSGAACTTSEISAAIGAPCDYLAKVMQSLVRTGLVRSQRGVHGGFTLNHAADDLSLLQVVNSVDPLRKMRASPQDDKNSVNPCPLDERLDAIAEKVEDMLRESTIGELLPQYGDDQSGCGYPRESESAA